MGTLFDVLLNRPLSETLIQFLLFVVFALHFLFVLFMLGTAILSVMYFMVNIRQPEGSPRRWEWVKDIYHTFIAHKSIAVVIGVAALLLVQVGISVPFLTATNLFGQWWLLIILFLILSFLTLELLGINWGMRPVLHFISGIFGLLLLLSVGGIFVAVLVTTEHPEAWTQIVHNGYRLSGFLSIHWLARYLHVLGAAIVFGSAFHYFFSKPEDTEKRSEMRKWMVGGLLAQFVLGILLYGSLGGWANIFTNILLAAGITSALVMLIRLTRPPVLNLKTTLPVLLFILLPMLLARQMLQERKVLPFNDALSVNAQSYQAEIQLNSIQALQSYQNNLVSVSSQGNNIFPRSCSFCHGVEADGQGVEAANLTIPPEKLSYIRTTPVYFHTRLITGVPGSAMPYFTMYTRTQLDNVMIYLGNQYDILGQPDEPQIAPSAAGKADAQKVFQTSCSVCHGTDGRGNTPTSANFQPAPPDLTQYTLNSDYLYQVVSKGYPGTMMAGFPQLSEDTRWGLVDVIHNLYQPLVGP